MIVRRGPDRTKHVSDFGPCPGGVDAAPETMALRAEVFVAPVERRYLSAEELAVIRQAEPEDPRPVAVMVIPTRTIVRTPEQMRASSLHGAQAAAARWEKLARHSLPVIWDAIREADGVIGDAAIALGQDPSNLRRRVRGHRDEAPADVLALMDDCRARRRVTTRALISLRNRQRWDRVRKAAA